MSDAFYIGYKDRAPRSLVRFLTVTVGLLLIVAVTVALTWSSTQPEPADGVYEYGDVSEWTGTLVQATVPMLVTDDGRAILLAGPVKGLPDGVEEWIGMRVSLQATRIYRDDILMLEVVAGSIQDAAGTAADWSPGPRDSTPVTLTGRIVDSKCWLGVMNPGEGTVHRACARLCIQGGLPAMLLYRHDDGTAGHALISLPDGRPFPERLLSYVARPVRLQGVLGRIPGASFDRLMLDEASLEILD